MGRRWLGWRFKDGTPLWFKVVVGLLMANATAHFLLLSVVPMWANSSRDAVHSYRIPFRDGVNYFVDPWLGRYLDAWWIGLGLLAILGGLLLLKRDELERGL